MKSHIVDPGIVPVVFRRAKQEALLSRFPWLEEGLSIVALPVCQGLGEGVAPCLGQQEDADDADESAAGKYNVMKEVTLLIVKVHDGSRQRTETSAGQDEAQTATSAVRKASYDQRQAKEFHVKYITTPLLPSTSAT